MTCCDRVTAEIIETRVIRYDGLTGYETKKLADFVNRVAPIFVDVKAYTHPHDASVSTLRCGEYLIDEAKKAGIPTRFAAALIRDVLPVWPQIPEDKIACAVCDELINFEEMLP